MAHQSMAALFLAQANAHEDRILYRFSRKGEWHGYSWTDVATLVEEIALGLVSLGVAKGDRVALLSANRVEWCLIDWANICIGALTVPLYSSSTPAQIHYIVGHAEASVLFVDSASAWGKLDPADPQMSLLGTTILIDTDDTDGGKGDTLSLGALREMGQRYGHDHPGVFDELCASLTPEDDLTIIYTSGTTGEPKGVLTTHGHYMFAVEAALAAIPCAVEDVALQFLPLAHSFGRLEHFAVVAKGYTCAFARSIDTLPADLQIIKPTLLFSVPRIYENAHRRIQGRVRAASPVRRALFRWAVSVGAVFNDRKRRGVGLGLYPRLAHPVASRLVLAKVREGLGGRLRVAVSGGAPLSPTLAEFFHSVGIAILEGYGLTETSTVTHVNRLDRYRVGTVGLPLDGVECRIAEDGEILIRGRNVLKGYYRDPDSTREAVAPDGWFHTGDVGEIDHEGFLRITDRKKDLIVTSGGKNIAPQMIENLLRQEPVISQAMVWGDKTSHLVALVTLNYDEIRSWAQQEGFELAGKEAAASDQRVVSYVRQRVREVNKQLAAFEAIRNFRVLPTDFSTGTGELTPSLKLKRRIVMERHKDILQEMLGNQEGHE